MSKLKLKKGDWCFCEFRLSQIMETKDDRITEVSNGVFRHSGSDLSNRCFPLDLHIKTLSENIVYWSDKFHELKNNSINHPDLNRELISRWVELCKNKDNKDKISELMEKLSQFGNSVIKRINDLSNEQIDDINLFRR